MLTSEQYISWLQFDDELKYHINIEHTELLKKIKIILAIKLLNTTDVFTEEQTAILRNIVNNKLYIK